VIQLDQKTKKNNVALVRLLLILPQVRFIPVSRYSVSVGRNLMQSLSLFLTYSNDLTGITI
jgi:hypothetical protein